MHWGLLAARRGRKIWKDCCQSKSKYNLERQYQWPSNFGLELFSFQWWMQQLLYLTCNLQLLDRTISFNAGFQGNDQMTFHCYGTTPGTVACHCLTSSSHNLSPLLQHPNCTASMECSIIRRHIFVLFSLMQMVAIPVSDKHDLSTKAWSYNINILKSVISDTTCVSYDPASSSVSILLPWK